MLVECGLLRVTTGDGTEATFRPSLERIAALGTPAGIVELFARLHGPHAEAAAADVLAGLCDPEDLAALPALIGGAEALLDEQRAVTGWREITGAIPSDDRVLLARHLMQHGIVGKATPGSSAPAQRGEYSGTFEADEYIAAAEVHLGMTRADAAALSMTEFQRRFEMKFPEQAKGGARDVPTADEYAAGMAAFEELKARRAAGKADHG